jgi:hypothetical protein
MSRGGLAFAALDFMVCLVLWMLMQLAPPPKPKSAVETFGTYAVTLTWPRKCDADEDLYLRQPDGQIVFFGRLNASNAHLEHDLIPGRGRYAGQANFERITLRGNMPGEYTVNVHTYDDNHCSRTRVRVQLWQLQGDDRLVTSRVLRMVGYGDEQTAFRFSLHAEGVYGLNRLPRSMVG